MAYFTCKNIGQPFTNKQKTALKDRMYIDKEVCKKGVLIYNQEKKS